MFTRMSLTAIVFVLLGGIGLAALTPGTLGTVHAEESVQDPAVSDRTVVFAIENMSCALCPVTVKKAISTVPGVSNVEVDLASKTATVAFDSANASSAEIATASTNAGYPAEPVAENPE